KGEGMLTRDAREKKRPKYGLKKAGKARKYSNRWAKGGLPADPPSVRAGGLSGSAAAGTAVALVPRVRSGQDDPGLPFEPFPNQQVHRADPVWPFALALGGHGDAFGLEQGLGQQSLGDAGRGEHLDQAARGVGGLLLSGHGLIRKITESWGTSPGESGG